MDLLHRPLSEPERAGLFNWLWLGLPASLLHLLGQFVPLPTPLDFLPGCVTAGLMIGALFKTRHDEFVARQLQRASEFALSVAGVMMAASLPLFGPLVEIDAALGLAIIGVAFNFGFAVLRLRGR